MQPGLSHDPPAGESAMPKSIRVLVALGLVAMVSAACQALDLDWPLALPAAPTLTPTEPAPTLGAMPATPDGPAATGEPDSAPEEVVLTVWVSEALSPSSETPGGQQMLAQLATFDELHPEVRVEVAAKLTTGPGSTLAYLRSAQAVAPSVLPDLALLDREALLQAAREDLVVPMDELVDPAIVEGLYPVAVGLGTVGDRLAGVPYVLQVQHVAYRDTLVDGPPSSFAAALNSPVPFVFPIGTVGNVNQTALAQYIAAGGTLADEEGTPLLDAGALAEVLTFYANAREANVIDPALFQMTDPAESWQLFLGRQAGMAVVTSTAFLADGGQVRSTGVTWLPTPDGSPFALATGWLWVVTTQEPERQAAAMTLFNFLMNPVNQGAFTQAAGWLPSQPGALAVWGDNDRYASFGDQLLRSAVPIPEPGIRATVGAAIQEALEDVLLSDVPPEQAASQAAQRVNPPEITEP